MSDEQNQVPENAAPIQGTCECGKWKLPAQLQIGDVVFLGSAAPTSLGLKIALVCPECAKPTFVKIETQLQTQKQVVLPKLKI
jgi:hypothetical protein